MLASSSDLIMIRGRELWACSDFTRISVSRMLVWLRTSLHVGSLCAHGCHPCMQRHHVRSWGWLWDGGHFHCASYSNCANRRVRNPRYWCKRPESAQYILIILDPFSIQETVAWASRGVGLIQFALVVLPCCNCMLGIHQMLIFVFLSRQCSRW